jgi:hypothetical protein
MILDDLKKYLNTADTQDIIRIEGEGVMAGSEKIPITVRRFPPVCARSSPLSFFKVADLIYLNIY